MSAPAPGHARIGDALAAVSRFGDLLQTGEARPSRLVAQLAFRGRRVLVLVDERWPQPRFVQVTGDAGAAGSWSRRTADARGRLLAALLLPVGLVTYAGHLLASLLQIPLSAGLMAVQEMLPRPAPPGISESVHEEALLYGVSMWPHLREGCILQVARASLDNLRPGDIVLVAQGPAVVAHRLVAKLRWAGRWWGVEKGDAILAMTAFSDDALLGRVVGTESFGAFGPRLYGHRMRRLAAALHLVMGAAWWPIGLVLHGLGAGLAWLTWSMLGRPSSGFSRTIATASRTLGGVKVEDERARA